MLTDASQVFKALESSWNRWNCTIVKLGIDGGGRNESLDESTHHAALFSATPSSFRDIGTAPPAIIILIVTLNGRCFENNSFGHTSSASPPQTFSRLQQQ